MYKIFQGIEPDGSMGQKFIIRLEDKAFIPIDDNNRHYKQYLEWLAQGNEPIPADETSNANL